MNIGDLPVELFEQIYGCFHFCLINKSLNNLDITIIINKTKYDVNTYNSNLVFDKCYIQYIYEMITYNNIKLLELHLIRCKLKYKINDFYNTISFFHNFIIYLLNYAITTFNKKILQLCIIGKYNVLCESKYENINGEYYMTPMVLNNYNIF